MLERKQKNICCFITIGEATLTTLSLNFLVFYTDICCFTTACASETVHDDKMVLYVHAVAIDINRNVIMILFRVVYCKPEVT